ncbi:hypothetical protein BD410DRAFT_889812 [Rickenella mellea]|uniref:Uncharacterized protein n=1 Tax=Rickenella mellea TaxID=50990 RepID=A0A4Y7PLM9_9AGAM|nr:hypothetical protein BD410DRAFT_889812 [Rickenella mellea]
MRTNPPLAGSSASMPIAQGPDQAHAILQLSQLSPELLQNLLNLAAMQAGTHQSPPFVRPELDAQQQRGSVQGISRDNLTLGGPSASSVATPNTLSNAPASRREPPIDPALLEASEIGAVRAEVNDLRAQLEELKRSRGMSGDDDGDADDEGEGRQRKRRKRKSSKMDCVLSVEIKQLTRQQKETRTELQSMIKHEMEELTGISKKEKLPEPDTPVSSQTDGSNHEHHQRMRPKLNHDVTHPKNRSIIMRAAELVWNEQTNDESRRLKHKDVKFTEADLRAFATTVLRSWRRRFEVANNVEKGNKAKLQARKNKRHQRQRTLKAARLAVADLYADGHDGANPSCLLETDWMTEEVSSLDTSDDEEKEAHREQIVQAARLTDKEIKCGTVLERIKPLFRSEEVDGIYEELDELGRQKQIESGKTYARKRRVDLGRTRVRPPVVPLYPFMVRESWFEDHIAGTDLEENYEVLPEDPEGFGSNA